MRAIYDRESVRSFTADLTGRLERCHNGEGTECTTLDATLRRYADLCCEYRTAVRSWAGEVFAGRLPPDSETDDLFRVIGQHLYERAVGLADYATLFDEPCLTLESLAYLDHTIRQLDRFVPNWVTPQLAVGPSARTDLGKSPERLAAMTEKLDALPPLPADWQPTDAEQRARFHKSFRQ